MTLRTTRMGHGLNTDFGFGSLVTFVFRILLFGLFVIELIFCIDKFLSPNTTDVSKLNYVQSLDVRLQSVSTFCKNSKFSPWLD